MCGVGKEKKWGEMRGVRMESSVIPRCNDETK